VAGCAQGAADRNTPPFDPQTGSYELPAEPIDDPKPRAETPLGRHGRLRVEGPDLVDADGNPVQLRGISSHWLNWETTGFAHNANLLMWMRDNWNVSLIRAAMGVGDDRGYGVSGGYLLAPERMRTIVERIVENAHELGVYAIVDWHDHIATDHLDEASEFFREMATKYRDYDNVIYEVFNEPIPRIRGTERSFTWPDDIKPYHETLVGVIREVNPDAIIVLGTPFWSQEVDAAAADPVAGTNLMYTLHFYTCEHTGWLRERAARARNAGLPIFVTEWGATTPSGGVPPETEVCDEEGDLWHQWMNENHISWAAWKLDDCADTSCFFAPGTMPSSATLPERLQGHGPYVVDKLKAAGVTSPLPGMADSGPAAGFDSGAGADAGPASAADAATGDAAIGGGGTRDAASDAAL
jgi:endoglucanase